MFFRLLEDEDLATSIKRTVEECGVKTCVFFVIGTLKNAVFGYYEEGDYKCIRLGIPLEIASCTESVSLDEKGVCFGGHLMAGSRVGATAEFVIIEGLGMRLQRVFDERTKLKLWKLSQSLCEVYSMGISIVLFKFSNFHVSKFMVEIQRCNVIFAHF